MSRKEKEGHMALTTASMRMNDLTFSKMKKFDFTQSSVMGPAHVRTAVKREKDRILAGNRKLGHATLQVSGSSQANTAASGRFHGRLNTYSDEPEAPRQIHHSTNLQKRAIRGKTKSLVPGAQSSGQAPGLTHGQIDALLQEKLVPHRQQKTLRKKQPFVGLDGSQKRNPLELTLNGLLAGAGKDKPLADDDQRVHSSFRTNFGPSSYHRTHHSGFPGRAGPNANERSGTDHHHRSTHTRTSTVVNGFKGEGWQSGGRASQAVEQAARGAIKVRGENSPQPKRIDRALMPGTAHLHDQAQRSLKPAAFPLGAKERSGPPFTSGYAVANNASKKQHKLGRTDPGLGARASTQ